MVNGFILIDKKVGVTSRSVDNKIQRLFHTHKVGHLGTLDPFASGLLIIAIDKGCKSLSFIDDSYKTYIATLSLGKKTDTGDLTGQIIEEKVVSEIDQNKIEEAFNSLLGESEQIPPMTSAIHFGGKRLYELSRKGIEVERKPRKILIKSLKLLSFTHNSIVFEVNCSRGTYVRTLGEDIANKLGTVGHLTSLRRTSIGQINVDLAKDIEAINEDDLCSPLSLISYKQIVLSDEMIIKNVMNGKTINLKDNEEKVVLCYYVDNKLLPLAVYQLVSREVYAPIRGLW